MAFTNERCEAVRREMKRFEERLDRWQVAHNGSDGYDWQNPVENGEVRRASLDLTRELARFRRAWVKP